VLAEEVPTVRSVTVGVWLKEGARQEPADQNGIAHFLEHLFFKGTENRTSRQIAVEVDRIGGSLDAYTSREYACYLAQVLDEHLDIALDLLSDILCRPTFPEEEMERERGVIFEEIKMVDDNPVDLGFDLLYKTMWDGHALGRPIQGTRESVGAISRDQVLEFFRKRYVPGNLLLSAAGNLKFDELLELVQDKFSALPDRPAPESDPEMPVAHRGFVQRHKAEIGQTHVTIAMPGLAAADERRYPLAVLNTLLGGGMSSRLFQKVREERGLAYSVYSSLSGYRDAGDVILYAGTSRENVREVLEVIAGELASLREDGAKTEEVRNAREHLKGGLMLALESTANRMSNLARQELYFGKQHTLDEVVERIEGVRDEDVTEIAREVLRPEEACMVLLGDVEGVEAGPELLCR